MTGRDKMFNFEKLVEAYENAVRHGYILYEAKKARKYGFDGGCWYEIALKEEKTRGQNDTVRSYVRIQAHSDDSPATIYVYFDGEATINSIDVNSDSFHVITELLLTMKNVLDEDGGKKIVLEFFDRLAKGEMKNGNE